MSKDDRYAQFTFDMVEQIQRAGTDRQILEQRISFALRQLGFEYVTVWTLPPPGQSPLEGVLMNTRPMAYVQRYVEENYLTKDPVIAALRTTSRPFSWGDVRGDPKLTKSDLDIINEAREFGIYDGFLVPIITEGGNISIVSPCGKAPDLSARARSATEMISIYGQQALSRCASSQDVLQRKPLLSPREREVLRWIAVGKSDEEIADLLRISRLTVTQHVESAKRKLGVNKRTPAAVMAFALGEISL